MWRDAVPVFGVLERAPSWAPSVQRHASPAGGQRPPPPPPPGQREASLRRCASAARRMRVRACVHACVRACVRAFMTEVRLSGKEEWLRAQLTALHGMGLDVPTALVADMLREVDPARNSQQPQPSFASRTVPTWNAHPSTHRLFSTDHPRARSPTAGRTLERTPACRPAQQRRQHQLPPLRARQRHERAPRKRAA